MIFPDPAQPTHCNRHLLKSHHRFPNRGGAPNSMEEPLEEPITVSICTPKSLSLSGTPQHPHQVSRPRRSPSRFAAEKYTAVGHFLATSCGLTFRQGGQSPPRNGLATHPHRLTSTGTSHRKGGNDPADTAIRQEAGAAIPGCAGSITSACSRGFLLPSFAASTLIRDEPKKWDVPRPIGFCGRFFGGRGISPHRSQ